MIVQKLKDADVHTETLQASLHSSSYGFLMEDLGRFVPCVDFLMRPLDAKCQDLWPVRDCS